MTLPLFVLAGLSIIGGFDKAAFAGFIATALPGFQEGTGGITETCLERGRGPCLLMRPSWPLVLFQRNPALAAAMAENPAARVLHRFWFSDWGMDWLYDRLFVRPVVWIARVNKADLVDSIYDGLASLAVLCYRALSLTETGKLRWYAAWIAGGSAYLRRNRDVLMILLWLILVPLIAGVLAWAAARWSAPAARWIALIAVLTDFVLALSLWIGNSRAGLHTWFAQADWAWIPQFGIRFHLAADGLSLLLLMLTFFLGIVSVLASWTEITEATGFFHLNLLWILAGIAGVFLAVNLFLFYFAWELMLVPMYFLISIWGHENRVYAAVKFFLFTQLSGLLMLIAILALFFLASTMPPVSTLLSMRNCWARQCLRLPKCGSCSASSSRSP